MLTNTLTAVLLAGTAVAYPVIDPITFIKRAPNPGVVINKCSQPGVLALAYDDGPVSSIRTPSSKLTSLTNLPQTVPIHLNPS